MFQSKSIRRARQVQTQTYNQMFDFCLIVGLQAKSDDYKAFKPKIIYKFPDLVSLKSLSSISKTKSVKKKSTLVQVPKLSKSNKLYIYKFPDVINQTYLLQASLTLDSTGKSSKLSTIFQT